MPPINIKDLKVSIPSKEDPDWGYARNKRALLRTANAEFSQSVYSATLNGLVIPNRDYSYEGLFAVIDGENWKFLDGLAMGIKSNGAFFQLIPINVEVFPWKSVFHFAIENSSAKFSATYYLLSETISPTLSIRFKINGNLPNPEIVIEPLLDIRHMYSASRPFDHKTSSTSQIEFSKDSKTISFLTKNSHSFSLDPKSQPWTYKLGVGDRQMLNEKIVFASESRDLFSPGRIYITPKKDSAELQIVCEISGKKAKFDLSSHDERKCISKAQKLIKSYSAEIGRFAQDDPKLEVALKGRLIALLENFSFSNKKTLGPDAGAFWFRNIWFRDAFQGIHDNFDLFYSNKKMQVKNLILRALECQKNGLVPNKLSEYNAASPNYNALDSTLLCFLCSLEYLKRTSDRKMQLALKTAVKSFFQSLEFGPILLDNYLLKCPANYSWIDSMRKENHFDCEFQIPNRIPREWISKTIANSHSSKEITDSLSSQKYFLVETNALWLLFLKEFADLFPSKEFEHSFSNAALTFKSYFFSEMPSHIVNEKFEKSTELGSPSLYSASLLLDLFSKEEIANLLNAFEASLVYRDRLLFGVLATNNKDRIFFGDSQYHSAVIWPRDSVALFAILKHQNDPRSKELLDSNLNHQMEEGAIFYNHELFSLPEGNNPHSGAISYFPIPVRNPAQFWSQWVAPYLEK
ncbi:MAG: amylo-alpha-1,6-glucosidase [Candidatus Micrarchaeota archaeon]